jgi:hypothetical protein
MESILDLETFGPDDERVDIQHPLEAPLSSLASALVRSGFGPGLTTVAEAVVANAVSVLAAASET